MSIVEHICVAQTVHEEATCMYFCRVGGSCFNHLHCKISSLIQRHPANATVENVVMHCIMFYSCISWPNEWLQWKKRGLNNCKGFIVVSIKALKIHKVQKVLVML